RTLIDRLGMAGRGHWRDFWWGDMAATGVVGIANHSWDHTHIAAPVVRQREQQKGSFLGIDNEADANAQIAEAQRFIWYRSGGLALPLFAYPYGDAPDYLVQDYLPRRGDLHGLRAAFGTQGDYVRKGQDVWHIPRFVCGQHWHTPGELEGILRGARTAR
ncbi:MAG: polysaccharide deacetylase family protein, partial [Casimicrobiaceae bacterium]